MRLSGKIVSMGGRRSKPKWGKWAMKGMARGLAEGIMRCSFGERQQEAQAVCVGVDRLLRRGVARKCMATVGDGCRVGWIAPNASQRHKKGSVVHGADEQRAPGGTWASRSCPADAGWWGAGRTCLG